jgi:hypothetical protein
VTSLAVSRLLNMERQLNHICNRCERSYPTIQNSGISIGTARHYVALHFWPAYTQNKCQIEQRTVVRCLTIKGFKAKDIEMEQTCVYDEEAFQMSARKKRQTPFL